MDNNQLTGNIPNFDLPNLSLLYLSDNQLIGSIPNFNFLPNLAELYLSINQLTGNIPNFDFLPNLRLLYLSSNQLIGNIPNFNNLPNLIELSLAYNNLTGAMPSLDDLQNLIKLQFQSNELIGNIPNFDLPNLRYLYLEYNQLSNIPNFDFIPNLRGLHLQYNQLMGSIPNFSLPNLQDLYLDNNQLIGIIPDFNLPMLFDLTVCDNNLFGIIPNFENCPNLNIENIDFSCVQMPKVKGKIFQDENQNCTFNENENTIPQGKILVNDGETYAFSNVNGEFILGLDTGTYTISYLPPNELWQQTCSNELESYTITIASYDDVFENINFANEAVFDCALMDVNINTPLQRRCFTNNYTVQYCNEGTETAEDAYVEIYFEEEIIVLDASIPYTVDDEIYTFELGNVGIGQCGSFTVTDSISCEAVLGSAVCAMAYIYPDDHCREISEEWDGSDIEVSAECLGDVVRFSIANNGEAMEDSSSYRMYEDDVLSAILNFKIAGDEVLDIDYAASGVTYRLVAGQRPGHPSKESSQAVVELCGSLPFSLGFVTSQSMANTESFFATHCEEIIGSYDPNDKLVTPKGIGEAHNIEANTDLEYKIRFQNTGNDTAFRVIVVDTLDVTHLDMSTFEALNSSHDYSLEIVEGQILRFTFDDILLVDSNANEPASHGFVSFKINQMLDNEVGTVIENQAYIFFDYNQPILTPLAFSTIWEEPSFEGRNIFGLKNTETTIYPNPANEHFFLDFSEAENVSENMEIKIYDVFGKLVFDKAKPAELIDLSELENGIYFVVLRIEQGIVKEKLIISK